MSIVSSFLILLFQDVLIPDRIGPVDERLMSLQRDERKDCSSPRHHIYLCHCALIQYANEREPSGQRYRLISPCHRKFSYITKA